MGYTPQIAILISNSQRLIGHPIFNQTTHRGISAWRTSLEIPPGIFRHVFIRLGVLGDMFEIAVAPRGISADSGHSDKWHLNSTFYGDITESILWTRFEHLQAACNTNHPKKTVVCTKLLHPTVTLHHRKNTFILTFELWNIPLSHPKRNRSMSSYPVEYVLAHNPQWTRQYNPLYQPNNKGISSGRHLIYFPCFHRITLDIYIYW